MSNRIKLAGAVVALGAVAALSGCSTIAEPDKVGLYYAEGSSDGYQFQECIDPGHTGPAEWNNSVAYVPASLRTWNVTEKGGDSNDALIVSTKPEVNQPSGVQVKVWYTTNFFLNTFCDDKGGVVREWWEKIGRRYGADTEDGWKNMLENVFVPVLKLVVPNVIRAYGADELVGNIGGVRAEAQQKVSEAFSEELKRTVGGDYYCGPSYVRVKADCPSIQILIQDVDYADPGIQEARNAKQKAIEIAAAKVAEAKGQAEAELARAEGEVAAAKKRGELYNNPAWVKLQMADKQLAAIQACAANPQCTIVIGADGNFLINNK